MMKKRIFAAATAVAMVASTFAFAATASAADRVVTVWSPYKSGNLALWDAALKRIEKANPGLTIKSVGSVDMAKSLAAINAGNGPDISVSNGAGNLGWFCGTGAWQKLNKYIAGSKGINLKSTFTPSAVAYSVADGNRCALPAVGSETFGFYYNKDLLKAAGYTDAPKTTAELLEMSKKLTKFNSDGSIKVAGFVPWAGYYGFEMDAMWLGQMFGAKWFSASGSSPTISSDKRWERAFNWQKKFIADVYGKGDFKKGSQLLTKFVAARGDEWGAGHDFITGRVAMKLDADWMAPMFCDPDGWNLNPCTKPAVNFGTAPFPVDAAVAKTYGSGVVGGQLMGISKGSKNVADAWIVLKGLATDIDLSIAYASDNGSVPVLLGALSSGKITYPAIYKTFYDIAGNPASGYHTLKNTGEHLEDAEVYNFMSAWQAGSVTDLSGGLADVNNKISSILARNN